MRFLEHNFLSWNLEYVWALLVYFLTLLDIVDLYYKMGLR